jgi:hypothetical protein
VGDILSIRGVLGEGRSTGVVSSGSAPHQFVGREVIRVKDSPAQLIVGGLHSFIELGLVIAADAVPELRRWPLHGDGLKGGGAVHEAVELYSYVLKSKRVYEAMIDKARLLSYATPRAFAGPVSTSRA